MEITESKELFKKWKGFKEFLNFNQDRSLEEEAYFKLIDPDLSEIREALEQINQQHRLSTKIKAEHFDVFLPCLISRLSLNHIIEQVHFGSTPEPGQPFIVSFTKTKDLIVKVEFYYENEKQVEIDEEDD